MNLSKLSALFFGAPAKTAGKRASGRTVKYKTVVRRFTVPALETCRIDSIAITNSESETIYVTIEKHFTKAGKK